MHSFYSYLPGINDSGSDASAGVPLWLLEGGEANICSSGAIRIACSAISVKLTAIMGVQHRLLPYDHSLINRGSASLHTQGTIHGTAY